MGKPRRRSAAEFAGRQVAVALNLHRCKVGQPKEEGEACFSIRAKPSSGSKVLGYVPEVWLEDVSFFVRPAGVERIQESGVRNVCCYVVGTVISARSPKVTKKNGWSTVRLDAFGDGCFYRATTGSCVRAAKYARVRDRKIEAFGVRNGEPVTSQRELSRVENPALAVLGPERQVWTGEMGGTNYKVASAAETARAIHWALREHPGAVIVDGSDDWNAPDHARPALLVRRYGIAPLAWWHTGTSGQEHTGVILSASQWAAFRRAYTREWGFPPDNCPAGPPPLKRPECGCYSGEGLAIYRF
jgi:hypothetical protein